MDIEKSLKDLLKKIKLSEPTISTLLGAAVIFIVGLLIFNYFKAEKQTNTLLEMTEEVILSETEKEQGVELVQTETETGEVQINKIYRVQAGDHLWQIAEKFYQDGYKWSEIAEANNLAHPDYLEIDQELKLPEVEKEETVATIETEEEDSQSIRGEKYVVKQGDYLWEIALKAYGDGYKWSEIAEANNLAHPDYLEIDQELILPR